ncbi:MAG: hypothetical protein IJX51_00325 [Clostridia bacterium]|nr:hypothetical protein [Clostridia bacterium]
MNRFLITVFAIMIAFALVLSVSAEKDIVTCTDNMVTEAPDTVHDTSADNTGDTDGGTASEEPGTDEEKGATDLKEYLMERIAPVAVGVLTSLVALASTVSRIRASLSSLDKSKEGLREIKETVDSTMTGVRAEMKKGMTKIEDTLSTVPQIAEDYRELKESYATLEKQSRELMEAVKTGFSSIPPVVENGTARKIAIIANRSREEK